LKQIARSKTGTVKDGKKAGRTELTRMAGEAITRQFSLSRQVYRIEVAGVRYLRFSNSLAGL
jgi:hypothetical protein